VGLLTSTKQRVRNEGKFKRKGIPCECYESARGEGTSCVLLLLHQMQVWGCATKSNIAVIQRYQAKLLRSITTAPWYVSNCLHSELHIPNVHTVFRERTATHRTALDSHPNPLIEPLVHPLNNRRLTLS